MPADQMMVLAADSARPSPGALGYMLHQVAARLTEGKGLLEYAGNVLANRAEVFDFGHMPDNVLRDNAVRAGPLLSEGLLSTPFEACVFWYDLLPDLSRQTEAFAKVRSYMGEDWADDDAVPRRYASCAVRVVPPGHAPDCDCQSFVVADFIRMTREESVLSGFKPSGAYFTPDAIGLVSTVPGGTWQGALLDTLAFHMHRAETAPDDVREAIRTLQLGSLADGVAGCAMLLSTKGVRTRVEEPPAKLNAKRARAGKEPLVRVTHVDTAHYVAGLRNASQRGTHASPVPHLRRGHRRVLASGRETWVRDALVNCCSLSEAVHRDHYAVR